MRFFRTMTKRQTVQLTLDVTGVSSSVALILLLLIFGFDKLSMTLVGILLILALAALFGSMILRLTELFSKKCR